MTDQLPFLIAGLTAGAVYGLAGVGLVLTYKTSGIFNFAHGALATVGAYLFFLLHVENELSWQLAAAIVVLGAGPLMGVLLELLARRVSTSPLAVQVAGTVGILLIVVAGVQFLFPADEVRRVPVFLSTAYVTWGETQVRVADLLTFGIALVVTAALALMFRLSRRGVQMRAVVDNPGLLALFGTGPAATRRIAWILGSTLVTGCGVLFAPLLTLDPYVLTFLVVAAFGAAAIGAFSNLTLTFAGGLLIGVLAAFSQKWFLAGFLTGLPSSLPFVVLFLVLLAFPRRFLVSDRFVAQPARPLWTAPRRLQLGSAALLVLGLATVPAWAGIHLTGWTLVLTLGMLFLSLSLLVKTSGQTSLCHVTFAAIGATTFSQLAVERSVPWLVALLLAGLTVVPIGAVLAIPAIRLTGLYLALATFGFGLTVQYMFYSADFMFGPTGAGVPMPRPTFLPEIDSDAGFYYLTLVLAALAGVLVVALTRSRLGRLLRGISDSPLAVATTGASANVTRVLVFCLSAFLAGISGALAGVAAQNASAGSYPPINSLLYFVAIMVTVGREPWNILLAAGPLALIPSYWTGENANLVGLLLFGVVGIAVAICPPPQVPQPVRRFLDERFRAGPRKARPAQVSNELPRVTVPDGSLELREITVCFGGVTAVGSVSLVARTGRISGLIGPNGAGKTTTFNAASGLLSPNEGLVLIDGHDVTRRSVAARARAGLGRTFQRMELLESLTVRENVRLGAEAHLSGANPLSHVLARPGEAARVARATDEAIALCGLSELAERPAQSLSTGQRRLVELARCLAGDFRIILMDEPSSGLDHAETRRFGEILTAVVAERGVGILLVEHDIALVTDVCDEVTVLDFGVTIFHGTPAQMHDSPVVQAAYLGVVDADTDEGQVLTDAARLHPTGSSTETTV